MLFAIFMSMVNFAWYASLPAVQLIIFVFVFKGFSTAYSIQAMLGKGLGTMVFQLICGRIIDYMSMSAFYCFLFAGVVVAFVLAMFFKITKRH